ncbi:hypothetical protein CFC21_108898, partial [Triticum aestivum]
GINITHQVLLS